MTAAERFVAMFEEFWAKPDPARLSELLRDDARLVQPLMPEARTAAEYQAQMARLLELIPDFSGRTRAWAAHDGVVLIQHTLGGTLGGRRIEWEVCDRITLVDGKVAERIAYFDSLPVVLAILRRPRAWLQFARLRMRPRVAR